MTSQKQILPDGEERSTSCTPPLPASPYQLQESEKERLTTASSGATLFEHSLKSDPLGLLSKMLLESKRWWNPCRTFRWSSKTVIAEKQAVSQDVSADLESLTESLTSSDYKDIPSAYSIYRLVPSARRTKGNGSGSSGILPTPCTTDWKTPLTEEQAKRYAEKHPNASCLNQLRQRALSGLLPTPRANKVNGMDLNNPKIAQRNKCNIEEEVAKMVVSGEVKTFGGTSLLSPLYCEEMMGFPSKWILLPFLSAGGEGKQ